jgi:ribonuclease E
MCQGTGMVRSVESVALDILRSIEDRLITDGVVPLVATTAVDVALYILNQKRSHLKDIEQRYRIPITVTADENLHVSQFVIERSAETEIGPEATVVHMDWAHHHPLPAPQAAGDGEQEGGRRRSRRRRRKRRGPGEQEGEGAENMRPAMAAEAPESDEDEEPRERAAVEAESAEPGQPSRKPRRRGRRGGRRGRSGQRPERPELEAEGRGAAKPAAAGEAAPANGDAIAPQNGRGGGDRPARHEPEPRERVEEPAFAAPVSERPSTPSETRAESEAAEEAAPPRRGWWSR